jgi:hypothetical protein
MTILKNVEIYWTKLDPEKPAVNVFDATKPKQWGLQIQTKDKDVRKAWIAEGVTVKTHRKDKEDDESEIMYYSANFNKNAVNPEGKKNPPVQVVDAKNRDFLDVNTIGNGSVANLRLLPRDFKTKDGKDKIAFTLMAVQLLKLKKYEYTETEAFDEQEEDMEIIEPEERSKDAEDDEY